MNRFVDIFLAIIVLSILLPVFLVTALLIYFTDFDSPLFVAKRVGKNAVTFNMYKFRSMRNVKALSHIVSTSENDPRITWIGNIIRKLKIDEFSQIINVLIGDMKFVGPRPNVEAETNLFTDVEKSIFKVKPGITDISSIVFSDLNNILKNSQNVNLEYNQRIRPWKSRLAILYIENRTWALDCKIILLTVLNTISRKKALRSIKILVSSYTNDTTLIKVASRELEPYPFPPPGSLSVVIIR